MPNNREKTTDFIPNCSLDNFMSRIAQHLRLVNSLNDNTSIVRYIGSAKTGNNLSIVTLTGYKLRKIDETTVASYGARYYNFIFIDAASFDKTINKIKSGELSSDAAKSLDENLDKISFYINSKLNFQVSLEIDKMFPNEVMVKSENEFDFGLATPMQMEKTRYVKSIKISSIVTLSNGDKISAVFQANATDGIFSNPDAFR